MMLHFKKLPIILAICAVIIGGPVHNVEAEGLGDFVKNLCRDYPSWLAENYPDPSPQLYNPINVSVSTESLNLTATFTEYQMFGHGIPENVECFDGNVDLSSGQLMLQFTVLRTRFGGKYRLEGENTLGEVKGQGTWNITTTHPSYIIFALGYNNVTVGSDNYLDLGPVGSFGSIYFYMNFGGRPVEEMDGIRAGGEEEMVKDNVLEEMQVQTQYLMEHPLPIPLHTYLTVAFATTPITDM